jgi:hypothetical protein
MPANRSYSPSSKKALEKARKSRAAFPKSPPLPKPKAGKKTTGSGNVKRKVKR